MIRPASFGADGEASANADGAAPVAAPGGDAVTDLGDSGKTADANKDRLKKIGIGPSLYDVIVTSGEMTFRGLRDQNEGFFTDLGRNCYLMSRGGDRSIVDGLDIEIVDDINDADFQ